MDFNRKKSAYRGKLSKGGRIQRNEPCPCGSGRKYKKCCLIEKERKRKMDKIAQNAVEQDGPSRDQALLMLHQYNTSRCMSHNGKSQMLANIQACLEALSASDDRDLVLCNVKSRFAEMVEETGSTDTRATFALNRLLKSYEAELTDLLAKQKAATETEQSKARVTAPDDPTLTPEAEPAADNLTPTEMVDEGEAEEDDDGLGDPAAVDEALDETLDEVLDGEDKEDL